MSQKITASPFGAPICWRPGNIPTVPLPAATAQVSQKLNAAIFDSLFKSTLHRRQKLTNVLLLFFVFSCEPNATKFPLNCTEENPFVPGEVMIKDWYLDFLPLYLDYVVLAGIVVVMHIGAFFALKLIPTYRTNI